MCMYYDSHTNAPRKRYNNNIKCRTRAAIIIIIMIIKHEFYVFSFRFVLIDICIRETLINPYVN